MPVQDLAELNNMKEIHRPTEPTSLEIFHCIDKWQKSQFLSYKKLFVAEEARMHFGKDGLFPQNK